MKKGFMGMDKEEGRKGKGSMSKKMKRGKKGRKKGKGRE